MNEHNFQWDDNTVREYGEWYRNTQGKPHPDYWGKDLLEVFKIFYKPKYKIPKMPVFYTKSWRIVAFKEINYPKGFIYPVFGDRVGPFSNAITVEQALKKEDVYAIHSVKRIFDGEIFGVGDVDERWGKIIAFKVDGQFISYICDDGKSEYIAVSLWDWRKESKRPPLGIEPQYIWKQKRIDELNSAMNRYAAANKPVPISWVAEIQELTEWLNNREEEKLFDAGNINAEDAFSYFKKFIDPHEKKQVMQDFLNYVKKIN